MELDKTRIAVRERGMLEILDLSLQVTRAYWKPLLLTFALGAIPLAVVNHLLIGWSVSYFDFAVDFPFSYVLLMFVLVIIEAPLASVFATAYLGKSVFLERPKIGDVVGDVVKLAPRIFTCQMILRGVLATWILLWFMDRTRPLGDSEGPILLLVFLGLFVLILRGVRPFINEIIILERNPLQSRNPSAMTIGRRSALLHGPNGGQLFGRGFACYVLCQLLGFSVYFGLFLYGSRLFDHSWQHTSFLVQVCLPLSMWLVAGFFAVVRFLSYLDLRIRQEGWEVELKLRAEANKLTSKLT